MTTAPVSDPLEARLTLPRKVQAFLVNAIKSHAITVLHATVRGEALLLRIYLWAEQGAEQQPEGDVIAADLPTWLVDQMARHAQDEERHATLLRRRLAEIGTDARRVEISEYQHQVIARVEDLVSSDPLFAKIAAGDDLDDWELVAVAATLDVPDLYASEDALQRAWRAPQPVGSK